MRIRIPNWVVCLLIVYITVMIMRDTYFYISPQAKQFESTIVDAYLQIPYPPGTVITAPFDIWRKAEHRWLSYRCKSLLTPVELTAFYDDFFQTLGAQKTVSHQTRTQRPPHPRTIVSTSYTYHTEDCIYYIGFYKNDVFWTNISISIHAAADNRLR